MKRNTPTVALYKLAIIIMLLLAGSTVFAQSDTSFLNKAVGRLGEQLVTEKVYLHLDKPNYFFGDTIWYKAYTVIGPQHLLSALSGVLYVELISPADSLVTRQMISLVSGIGWSDIPLPPALRPGAYRIRAYTRWMQNMGKDCFYDQSIQIGGIIPEKLKLMAEQHPDVQFFPEGGQLVNGVRSKIAFKALGVNGLGVNITGKIEDNTGNVVADIVTQHLGMGVFGLTPEAGKSYKAMINEPGEEAYTISLPEAVQEGYTLVVNNSYKDSISIKIRTNEQTFYKDKDKAFYVIAQTNGKVYYTSQCKLENIIYKASIARNRFPEGITEFTLFNEYGEPLAERLVFLDNKQNELKIAVGTDIPAYTLRQKVKMTIEAKDDSDKAITGSFSVAVINESNVQPDENSESTILNNLLFTSELKGYIEQPDYYFSAGNEQTRENLDILMLTQGYRRFAWKQLLNKDSTMQPQDSITYLPERTEDISGKLATQGHKPVPNGKVYLVAAKQNIFRDTVADTAGRFIFTDLRLTDTATLILRAGKAPKANNIIVTVLPPKYPEINPAGIRDKITYADTALQAKAALQYFNYKKEQDDYFNLSGKVLKTVNVKSYRRPEPPELSNSANLNGPGNADKVIMGDELGNIIELSDYLYASEPEIQFTRPDIVGMRIPYLKRVLHGRLSGPAAGPALPMTVIVDGAIVASNHLDDINPADVYSIEVLTSGANLAIYGSNAMGGAIVITTRRGGEKGINNSETSVPGLISFLYSGFYKSKEFYMPKYQHKSDIPFPDNRTTIYWNPNIITDKDGKAMLEYNNNDTKGTYRVVVEGIDDDGNLGRQVYRYKVQ